MVAAVLVVLCVLNPVKDIRVFPITNRLIDQDHVMPILVFSGETCWLSTY